MRAHHLWCLCILVSASYFDHPDVAVLDKTNFDYLVLQSTDI